MNQAPKVEKKPKTKSKIQIPDFETQKGSQSGDNCRFDRTKLNDIVEMMS
jgi:hypothetical protein